MAGVRSSGPDLLGEIDLPLTKGSGRSTQHAWYRDEDGLIVVVARTVAGKKWMLCALGPDGEPTNLVETSVSEASARFVSRGGRWAPGRAGAERFDAAVLRSVCEGTAACAV